jgi:diaminopimelate decarboxylase
MNKETFQVPQYYQDVWARLPEIAKRFGTPFHIYNKPAILETGAAMIRAFNGCRYRNYFAVKALPNPWIMKFLFEDLGFGFDCSSISEVILARSIGATAEDIMFTSNNTTDEEFRVALQNGGCILNLDDITLIDRVPEHMFPELICFRINPGKRRTGNSIIGNPYDSKYGITYDQIIPAYAAAKKRGAIRFGIHTMVCSNELNSQYFVDTARSVLEVAAKLRRKLGIKIEFINIGGGFGIPYKPGDEEIDLDWVGSEIHKLLKDFGAEHGFVPKLFTECGRYVTGPHGILVNRVINIMDKYRRFIGVEVAMSGLMRHGVYGSYHHIDILTRDGKLRRGKKRLVSVAGPICENCDRLATNRMLPASTKIGDLVVTYNTGAHGLAMAFQYNGRPRPKELLDQTGANADVICIRRAETPDDLFRTIVPIDQRHMQHRQLHHRI